MWKPRNKWQLQTKGGCESSGGSSSDSSIVIRGTVQEGDTIKFEPIAPNLTPEQLVLADVITINATEGMVSRSLVSQVMLDALGYRLAVSQVGTLIYDPSTGAISSFEGTGRK